VGAGNNSDDVTVGSVVIGSAKFVGGIAIFNDASDSPGVPIDSVDAMTAAITYLSSVVSANSTAAFDFDLTGGGGVAGTIVFHGNAGGDIAITLVGVAASDLGADLDLI
jgi:hypothetical protein